MNKRNWLYGFILLIGFLQTIGYLTKSKEVRGIGMATASSPLPLVFTDVRGVETFASEFILTYQTDSPKTLVMTPEIYSHFKGPYNRRNVYGAAFAYAPLLPDTLRKQVLHYALCQAQMLKEMGVEQEQVHSAFLKVKTRTQGRSEEWNYAIDCE